MKRRGKEKNESYEGRGKKGRKKWIGMDTGWEVGKRKKKRRDIEPIINPHHDKSVLGRK